MAYKGIDTAAHISADAAKKLKALGVSFAGRYLVPAGMGKDITAEEAKGLHDAGLAILLCWEIDAARAKRGGDVGAADGARARQIAQSMGVPSGTAIFFAVDFMPVSGDYSAIQEYFLAAYAAVAPYRCGIYGPYDIVRAMKERIPQLMVWQCVAWSSGLIYDRLNFYQRLWSGAAECKAIQAEVGFPVDINTGESLDGLWQPAPEKPWYADAMSWAADAGLIRDGRPNDYVTRAELATVLYRLYGPEDTKTSSGLLMD